MNTSDTNTFHERAVTSDDKKNWREAELLQRTARGDETAFRELFDLHQPSLLYLVSKITRDMGISEEIVQDIFLKIWLTRESLAVIENFRNYLFIVSRNQALKLLDKELRERNRQTVYKNDLLIRTDDVDEIPYHLIDEAIHALPPQQQTAWLLSRHQGYSYDEIAERMGISAKTVKRHIRLATDSIKAYLVDHSTGLLLLLLASGYL